MYTSNLQRKMISTKQVHQSSDWLWIFTPFGRWEKVVRSGITSLWLIWLKLLSPSLWCWLFSLQTEGQNSNHNKNHLGSRYVSFLDFVYKNVTFSQFRCKPASPLKSEHHHTFRSFSLIGWANNKHSDITSVLMEQHILKHWNHISMNATKTGGMSLCNRVEKYGGACQNGLHSSILPKCRKQNQKLWNHHLDADSISEKKHGSSHDLKCYKKGISPGLCFDSKEKPHAPQSPKTSKNPWQVWSMEKRATGDLNKKTVDCHCFETWC